MNVTLYVYGGPRTVSAIPDQIVIEKTEAMHDLATLTFSGAAGQSLTSQFDLSDVTADDIGPPAVIEIVSSSVLTRYHGYIDTTVESTTRNNEPCTEIYFLAATSIMRNGQSRVWRDEYPFKIAGDLLETYGLGLEMDKIPYRMASFTQSRESDWESLRNLATLNGLSLTAAGTIVYLKDVINETRRAKGSALTPAFRRPGTPVGPAQECSQFTQVASRTPIGGERYRYYGIDHLGASFEVSGGVSSIGRSPGVVVKSLGAAQREARRHEAVGRYVTSATLEAPGVSACSSGTCISIDKNRFPEYWYVTSSKHTLVPKTDGHTMTLELCRQEGDTPGYVPTRIGMRPSTVLIGKNWRCDRSWRIEL